MSMTPKQFRSLRWAYTVVLLLALGGFLWRGVRPDAMFNGLEAPDVMIVRSIAWVGFVLTLGLILLPWWPWKGLPDEA